MPPRLYMSNQDVLGVLNHATARADVNNYGEIQFVMIELLIHLY